MYGHVHIFEGGSETPCRGGPMKRPVGITIVAVLMFVNVASYGALLLLAVFKAAALAAVLSALSRGGAGPVMQLRMGTWLPLYYGCMIAVTLLIGLGLWKLWNCTRTAVLVMIGVSVIGLV